MDILLIVLLTLLNGVFAMSELALASSRKARLTAAAEAGDKGSQAALSLLANPTQFLSSVQVGITSIGMLNGIIGEAAFSGALSALIQTWGVSVRAADISATALVVVVITYITIVFGELVPKRIGQLYPETVARLVARPMMWVAIGARPFVRLLSFSTHVVLKLLRVDNEANRAVTEEEITASLEEGVSAGLIEEHEHQMVQNVFLLDDRLLTSLMLPRSEIQWLDANDTLPQAIAKASVTGHSWYPVCRGSLDEVMGVVKLSDLLAQSHADANAAPVQEKRVADCTLPAVFVPESLSGMELLEQFRERSTRILLVVDEYGTLQGLITLEDILEEIVGEITDEFDLVDKSNALKRADDGSYLVEGAMTIRDLNRATDWNLPDDEANTVAGLVIHEAQMIPAQGQAFSFHGFRFEVVTRRENRLTRLKVRKL